MFRWFAGQMVCPKRKYANILDHATPDALWGKHVLAAYWETHARGKKDVQVAGKVWAEPYFKPDPPMPYRLVDIIQRLPPNIFFHPSGSEAVRFTPYRGRLPIHCLHRPSPSLIAVPVHDALAPNLQDTTTVREVELRWYDWRQPNGRPEQFFGVGTCTECGTIWWTTDAPPEPEAVARAKLDLKRRVLRHFDHEKVELHLVLDALWVKSLPQNQLQSVMEAKLLEAGFRMELRNWTITDMPNPRRHHYRQELTPEQAFLPAEYGVGAVRAMWDDNTGAFRASERDLQDGIMRHMTVPASLLGEDGRTRRMVLPPGIRHTPYRVTNPHQQNMEIFFEGQDGPFVILGPGETLTWPA
jgi:hypothetical protein